MGGGRREVFLVCLSLVLPPSPLGLSSSPAISLPSHFCGILIAQSSRVSPAPRAYLSRGDENFPWRGKPYFHVPNHQRAGPLLLCVRPDALLVLRILRLLRTGILEDALCGSWFRLLAFPFLCFHLLSFITQQLLEHLLVCKVRIGVCVCVCVCVSMCVFLKDGEKGKGDEKVLA